MVVIVSAPSGAGKGRLIKGVLEIDSDLRLSVSCTTRKKRPGEEDGVDYYFRLREAFLKDVQDGKFAEWAEVFGNGSLYGTLKSELEPKEKNKDVLVEIDCVGADQIKERMPEVKRIFILPPSPQVLEQRLRLRASGEKEDDIKVRLATAIREVRQASAFDYWIVNDDFETAKTELILLIDLLRTQERTRCQLEGDYRDPKVLSEIQSTFVPSN